MEGGKGENNRKIRQYRDNIKSDQQRLFYPPSVHKRCNSTRNIGACSFTPLVMLTSE